MKLRWQIAQFFEINWWRRYLGKRERGAYLDWKRRYWKDFLEKSGVQVPEKKSVLDAGCGPAGIFMILENNTVDALDPLLLFYEQSLPHFRRSDYPFVRFIDIPLEKYVPEKRYDVVFCLNAINHVADLQLCADRLSELVKPGGTLLLSIDAHNFALLKRLFRLLPVDILHPHQYDLEEYKNMLGYRGFSIDRTLLIKKEVIFNYYLIIATLSVPAASAAEPGKPGAFGG